MHATSARDSTVERMVSEPFTVIALPQCSQRSQCLHGNLCGLAGWRFHFRRRHNRFNPQTGTRRTSLIHRRGVPVTQYSIAAVHLRARS